MRLRLAFAGAGRSWTVSGRGLVLAGVTTNDSPNCHYCAVGANESLDSALKSL